MCFLSSLECSEAIALYLSFSLVYSSLSYGQIEGQGEVTCFHVTLKFILLGLSRVAQVIEHLPSKREALSCQNPPSSAKKK
jgi:hypothetical protein